MRFFISDKINDFMQQIIGNRVTLKLNIPESGLLTSSEKYVIIMYHSTSCNIYLYLWCSFGTNKHYETADVAWHNDCTWNFLHHSFIQWCNNFMFSHIRDRERKERTIVQIICVYSRQIFFSSLLRRFHLLYYWSRLLRMFK